MEDSLRGYWRMNGGIDAHRSAPRRTADSETRRRVLHLCMFDPHVPIAGGAPRGQNFSSRLAERFDVDLLYLDSVSVTRDLAARFAHAVKGVRSKTAVRFSQTGYFLFSPRLYRAAANLLREHAYHAIVCDLGMSALYGWLLSRRFGVRFVYSSHNVEHQMYRDKAREDWRRWPLVPYVYLVERLGARSCDLLVAINQSDAEFFARWADPAKIMVIPQCVDTEVFNPFYSPSRNETKTILFSGDYKTVFNREAVDIVVERILPRVLADWPQARFVFVGSSPPTHIQHPQVEFTGFVDDYPAVLRVADVFISPIRRGHGFPTKMVEALACGKPIVSTPIGARGIGGGFSRLYIREIDEFPAMILRLLREDRAVSADDFEEVQARYSWPRYVSELADRIESL